MISTLYAPHIVGGAERVVQDLAEALAEAGHSVSVATLGPAADDARATLSGVRVDYLRLRNLYWPFPVARASAPRKVAWHLIDTFNPLMGRAVGAWLDEVRPEVVNTHNLAGFSVAAWVEARRRGLPIVHTLHDHYLLCPYTTMFRNGANCARRCAGCAAVGLPRKRTARGLQAVIGVSRYILGRHLDYGLFGGARRAVVYSGVATPSAMPGERRAPGPLRIGFLGGLHPAKGVDGLLEAFLALPEGSAELQLAGAGDPAYAARLKSRAAGRTDVRWHGFVDPAGFLPSIDVLVVPSRVNEAMGRVVLEALASGVPVIAARRGGIPELLDDRCGRLYEPDRAGELTKLLAALAHAPEALSPMREAARARAGDFGIADMLAGYLAAYRGALERT